MAVGDVINGIVLASTFTNFQPAAGVEVAITSVLGRLGDVDIGLYDGATYGRQNINTATIQTLFVERIMINNTNYFRMYSNGQDGSYSGIQIK